MADIRINALATTAASTASDDFVAVDGSANGTRKLNAYSPTFGGNLTVSGGTGTIDATSGTANATLNLVGRSSGTAKTASVLANSSGSLVFGAEGAGSSMTIAANTGNTTIAYNATVSGNLTVSGTGASSFGGDVRLPWGSPSLLSYFNATYSLGLAFDSTNRKLVLRAQSADAPANGKGTISFETGATPSEIARFAPSTGNLLLKSDGIDSANGKLQLATHTTSAGGIGFGTVASLHADGNNGYLALTPPSGTTAGYRLYNSTTLRGQLAYSGTDVYLDSSTGSLILRTNGSTTALTLDSSQNATFAGSATLYTIGASSTGSNSLVYTGADGNGNVRTVAKIIGKHAGNGGYGNLVLQTAFNNSLVDALTINSSQAATFTGNIGAGGVNPVVAYSSGGSFYGSGANPQVRLVATSTGGWAFSTYTNVSATGNWSAGLQATGQTYRITNDLDLNGTAALSIAPTTLATTFGGTISTSAPTGGAGAWELGVYTATAPTATGYVTIEIGGTQYKLLAATA